jgi:type IV fimbrial biogenesis protein FimT
MTTNDCNCQVPTASVCRLSRNERGFTLTELVVTVALAAILATIAVPSFNGIIATQRARTLAADLYVTIAKTRAEAISLNNNVTLQPNAGGWANGWQILDVNNNVLDNHAAATGVTVATPTVAVTYRASGRLPVGVAPMFVISTMSGATVNYQCVSVDPGGRPYIEATPAC